LTVGTRRTPRHQVRGEQFIVVKRVTAGPAVIAQSRHIAICLDRLTQSLRTTHMDDAVERPQSGPTVGRPVRQHNRANRSGDCDDLARNFGADDHDNVRTHPGDRISDRRYVELHDRIVTPRLKVGGDVSNLIQVVTDKKNQRRVHGF
jgi:hypothetical protein